MTLLDAMEALYEKYGWYKEKTLNLVMPGLDGLAKMKALMDNLRETPPESIGGEEVIGNVRAFRKLAHKGGLAHLARSHNNLYPSPGFGHPAL